MIKLLRNTLVLLLLAAPLSAQDTWEVTEEQGNRLSPFAFDETIQKSGENIFNVNCASCHGHPGKADFIALQPSPGDPASEKFSLNTDGALFHKIREGRGGMPSFKAILSTDEIWQVISYIRTFHDGYTQEVAKEIVRTGFDGGEIKIALNYKHAENKIVAEVKGEKEGQWIPIAGAAVKLYAKRLFGNLQIDEQKTTNETGIVSFVAPKKLPGDSSGIVGLLAVLPEEDMYGVVKSETTFEIGVPTSKPSLVAKRAMWNIMKKAPIWLYVAYFGVVLIVWGCIGYILLQVREIYLIGKAEEENDGDV